MSLFQLRPVLSAHHESLGDNEAERRRARIWLYAPAVGVLATLTLLRALDIRVIRLDGNLSQSLAGALALLAGVLFSIGVVVMDKTVDMEMTGPEPTEPVSRAVRRLTAISANALFAATLAGALVGILLLGDLIPALSAVAAVVASAGFVLLGTTGALVVGRLFSDTQSRADRIRSGAARRDRTG